MPSHELLSFANDVDLAQAVATQWLSRMEEANRTGQHPSVALSGGRIARTLFSAAASLSRQRRVPLSHIHFFWGDERCVPPRDAESNFGAARQLLFEPMQIPAANIHRIRGEDEPRDAVKGASQDLRKAVAAREEGWPMLDLVFLGMGEDGHVASLFPSLPSALLDSQDIYLAVKAEKPPPHRISLTYGMIAAAREVWVLASGAGKERALRASLAGGNQTPLGRVLGRRRQTKVFSDIPLS
jgi:6-phosphogluconolactonase